MKTQTLTEGLKVRFLMALIFIFLFEGNLKSQIKSVEPGKLIVLFQPMGLGSFKLIHSIVSCDTFLASNQYYKLYHSDENGTLLNLSGFVREDDSLQQLYWLGKNSDEEVLFVDYSLNVGDTFKKMEVKKVFYQERFGKLRKHIYFDTSEVFGFIEGLGSTFYGFWNDLPVTYRKLYNVYEKEDMCLPTSTKELAKNILSIYPNPSADQIFIRNKETKELNYEYTIYNTIGQVMGSGKYLPNNYIDCQHLTAGVYLILLKVDQKVFYKKIVKV